MKKLIKKCFCLVTIIIVVIVTVALYCFGFRITYPSELETSWNAVSAVAAWAGVIMSSGAIIVAIWIPKKIADRQDKIALSEKRIQCYITTRKIFIFCIAISDRKLTNDIIIKNYKLNLGDANGILKIKDSESINLDLADVCAFEQYSALVHSGQFLLKNYDSNFVLGMLMKSNEIVGYITESELGRVGPISREVEKLVNELLKDYDKLKNLLNDIQKEISLLD